MRMRKPCVFNRLRTLGCQVRLVAIFFCSCLKSIQAIDQTVASKHGDRTICSMLLLKRCFCSNKSQFFNHARTSEKGAPQNQMLEQASSVTCIRVKMALYASTFGAVKSVGKFRHFNSSNPLQKTHYNKKLTVERMLRAQRLHEAISSPAQAAQSRIVECLLQNCLEVRSAKICFCIGKQVHCMILSYCSFECCIAG